MHIAERQPHAILDLVKSHAEADPAFVHAFRDQASSILTEVQDAFSVAQHSGERRQQALADLQTLDRALRQMMVQNARQTEANQGAASARAAALTHRTAPGLEGATTRPLHKTDVDFNEVPSWCSGYSYSRIASVRKGYAVSAPEHATVGRIPETRPMTGVLAFSKDVARLTTLCSALAPAGPIGLTAAHFAQSEGSTEVASEVGLSATAADLAVGGQSRQVIRSTSTSHSPDVAINGMVRDLTQRLEAVTLVSTYRTPIVASHEEQYYRTNASLRHPRGQDTLVTVNDEFKRPISSRQAVRGHIETVPNQPAFIDIPGTAWEHYESLFSHPKSVPEFQV